MLEGHQRSDAAAAAAVSDPSASFDELSDVLAIIIFGFFRPEELVMCVRCVCKNWRDVAREMIVPTEFVIDSVEKYNAMSVMTRELPNLQQIKIDSLGYGEHKWSDGEDPENSASWIVDYTSHDIGIISNFSKLRILRIEESACAPLNGRYPVFFNFPCLQKLTIFGCRSLKWDLDMLSGLPLLKELYCWKNDRMTGTIESLIMLKDTLVKVEIRDCGRVEGNFMDLADFPHLKELNLDGTAVRGDIRDIGKNDFLVLEQLVLPRRVYGGKGYRLQRISDAPDLVRAVYLLKKQRPALKMEEWHGRLSTHSPDWYNDHSKRNYLCINGPPFYVRLVEAGSRIGYRWADDSYSSCEVNWLDPEPSRESSDYGQYIEGLQHIRDAQIFTGWYQPPPEEECNRLLLEDREAFKDGLISLMKDSIIVMDS
jgi:hypothetical protein